MLPRLLDLFCKAGGAGKGYSLAGFDVVGVDIEPQPHYPFPFVQADALRPPFDLREFDAIHASPPCQAYSCMSRKENEHKDLYDKTRQLLAESGRPWVIENVIGAPYHHGIVLCGSMFGLPVRRHRNFETSHLILNGLQCQHRKQGRPITVTGNGGGKPSRHSFKGIKAEWPRYMGMEWATPQECTQAIPPAYTEYIGKQLLKVI
jgi:DNA (cytosine-5)-methyltransferase 1